MDYTCACGRRWEADEKPLGEEKCECGESGLRNTCLGTDYRCPRCGALTSFWANKLACDCPHQPFNLNGVVHF